VDSSAAVALDFCDTPCTVNSSGSSTSTWHRLTVLEHMLNG
jgi:hypothetical protein